MSFGLSSDEAQIAQNLGDLGGYLGQRGYVTAPVPINPDGTIGRIEGGIPASAPGYQVPYVAQGVGAAGGYPGMVPGQAVPQNQPPVIQGVPPDQFQALQEYALRLEQANLQVAQQAIQAEEQAFLYAIADLPEEEKVIAWQERQIAQLAQANGALSTNLQTREQMAEEDEQAYYKEVVAEELCRRAGINFANPQVEAAFMGAQTREDMDNLVTLITANRSVPQAPQQPQQTQAQRAAGLVAAGANGGAGRQAVRQRSGDLMGYLKQKGGYQVAYIE